MVEMDQDTALEGRLLTLAPEDLLRQNLSWRRAKGLGGSYVAQGHSRAEQCIKGSTGRTKLRMKCTYNCSVTCHRIQRRVRALRRKEEGKRKEEERKDGAKNDSVSCCPAHEMTSLKLTEVK